MKISAWTPRLIECNFDVRRVLEGDVRNKCLVEYKTDISLSVFDSILTNGLMK